jgi:hypothetical protein
MKRIHSPSLFIGWRTEKFLLDNSVEPLRATSYWHTYGCHNFRPGLHYRIDDPAFFEKWAETLELYPQRACDFVHLPMWQYHDAARRVLGTIADASHIAIHDNLVVDRRILERIETDGWEDMVLRSATSIADAVVTRSAPHLHSPGPLRSALEELKTLVSILPHERPDDFDASMDDALASIPNDGNWAREWYINNVLERWNGREVALSLERSPHSPLQR